MHGLFTDHLKKIATSNQDKIHILIQRIVAATKERFDSEEERATQITEILSAASRKREEKYLTSLQTRRENKKETLMTTLPSLRRRQKSDTFLL